MLDADTSHPLYSSRKGSSVVCLEFNLDEYACVTALHTSHTLFKRERERERDRDRGTDKERERETERERQEKRETERERDREGGREREIKD